MVIEDILGGVDKMMASGLKNATPVASGRDITLYNFLDASRANNHLGKKLIACHMKRKFPNVSSA